MLSRLQWVILPLVLIGGFGVFVYLGYLWTRPQGEVLSGYVTMFHFNELNPLTGGGCTPEKEGPGEFSDLKKGTPVVIRGESGNEVARGQLSAGFSMLSTCRFVFDVGPVPPSGVYTIQVGDRAPASFTYDQLVQQRWSVSFDYGGQVQQTH
jgi:hypothetical protein